MAGLRRLLAALSAVILLAAGCSATPVVTTFDAALTGRVDAAITTTMASAGIPGAMVGVWSPDGEYVKAFGVADTATKLPMRTDFYSRIGSVTKTFTATLVLQLAEDGVVGLDDPIGRYVGGVPAGEKISVRQLLTMRSGLTDYTKAEGFEKAVAADPRRQFTPQELLGWAFGTPAQFRPGEEFEYSNTNYVLLGLLVEKVSGRPFADYLDARILTPLAMTHTSFPTGTWFPDPHAQGYTEPDEGTGPPVNATDWSASFTWAAGAMVSTLDDMRIWVPALATGKLLSPDMQKRRLGAAPEPGRGARFSYGMGIFDVAGWVGHNGSVPGYQTVAMYLPQHETTLVIMINTDIAAPGGGDPAEALATAITSVITPDSVYRL